MGQQQVTTGEEPPHQPDMSVGEILRLTREHYGQRISDIERVLNIRAIQIEAIEADRFERLPGTVYATGFIRSYSAYLGLDPDHMVHLFKNQSGVRNTKPELHFPVAAAESRTPNFWLVGMSVLAGITLIGLIWSLSSRDRSIVTDIPEVPATIRAESRDIEKTPAVPAGPPVPEHVAQAAEAPPEALPGAAAHKTVAAADQSDGIILRIVDNSWVEIKDGSGKALVSRVLNAGDKYFVPSRPDLFMSLGNSGGVRLEIDGKELSPLGEAGQVIRNIPLDMATLKQKFPPQP